MTDLAQDNQCAREAGLSYGMWRAAQVPDMVDFFGKKHVFNNGWFDITLFCELYNYGFKDNEIASRMGYCIDSVLRFRKAHNLPHNHVTLEVLESRPKITVESLVDESAGA